LNSPIPSGGSYNWRQQVRDQNARRRGGLRGRGGSRSSGRGSGIKSSSRGGQSSYEMFDSSPHVSTTTIAPQCQGNMTLWSRTYLRGESFPLSDDIEDLSLHGFDNKLVSLEVSAGCCWTIFSEPHFEGDSKVFREGQHKSVSSVGKLFRAASSVKKTSCY